MYSYPRTNWQNSPSKSTPINATRLNNIEGGITNVAAFSDDVTYNMISYPFYENRSIINGLLFTEVNGVITVSGTATADTRYVLETQKRLVAGTYNHSGCPSTGGTDSYNIYIENDENKELISVDEGGDNEFTITNDIIVNIGIYIASGETVNETFSPCLTKGNKQSYYPPLGTGSNFADTIKWYADSLNAENTLPYPYNQTTMTSNGVQWTDLGDGRVMASGKATANSNFYCTRRLVNMPYILDKGKEYILSGCPKGGAADTYYIWANTMTGGAARNIFNDYGEGSVATIPMDAGEIGVYLTIYKGATVNNLIFEPMIVEGNVKYNYRQYSKYSRYALRKDIDALLAMA